VIPPAPLPPPLPPTPPPPPPPPPALLAAYGSVVMPELELMPTTDDAPVEVQGELNSPSGKALAKAVRRGEGVQPADLRQREPQV
jgi:hypothetical protein